MSTRLRSLHRNALYWLRGAPDGLPIPPAYLRDLTWSRFVDLSIYFADWGGTARRILDKLARHGVRIDEIRAMLDFGCGNGRTLREFHFIRQAPPFDGAIEHAKFYGTDINPDQIAWCKRNLPFAEFDVNQATPPLPYQDERFDLIYNHSVFTHLSEPQQLLWMAELARVLKVGGNLLLTTCGESYLSVLTEVEKELYRAGQLVVRHPELAGIPSAYGACHAIHPIRYVKERMIQGFELIDFGADQDSQSGGMDEYVLRKMKSA